MNRISRTLHAQHIHAYIFICESTSLAHASFSLIEFRIIEFRLIEFSLIEFGLIRLA